MRGTVHFNSRTSCEVRPASTASPPVPTTFQLTHLLRGATWRREERRISRHFNSRTSCEVRRHYHDFHSRPLVISTHAPLARCDRYDTERNFDYGVSTHAPLARCDISPFVKPISSTCFNSRTSCEVRRIRPGVQLLAPGFNSRTSCEVRHVRAKRPLAQSLVSTHTPLARCDDTGMHDNNIDSDISTHAPLARCDNTGGDDDDKPPISTHAPLARCDSAAFLSAAGIGQNFNSRTSCEVRPEVMGMPTTLYDFNSRTSCEVRHGGLPCAIHYLLDFNSRTSCEVRLPLHLNFN